MPFDLFGGGLPLNPLSAAQAAGAAASKGPFAGMNTALGGATSLFGFPMSIALPILFSVLGSAGLFGGEDPEEKKLQEALALKQQMKILGIQQPYQSPYLPAIDRTAFQAIINNLRRTANWGWPAGKQMDLSWLDQLLPVQSGRVPPGTKIRY